MADQNYELAPRQGQTATQRKAELDSARFVAVRNLAYMTYKRQDGQPLMTYQEALDDRERVKQVILQHEIASGLIVNDLGVGAPAAGPAPMPAPGQQQMAPAAAPGFAPAPAGFQPGYPQTQPQAAPPPYAAAPQMTPAGVGAPATAAQAAQVPAGAPAEQAPPATQTTGRKRRSSAGGAPAGAAVAPPPAGPAPMAPQAAQAPFPGQQMAPMGQAPFPAAAAPQAPAQALPAPSAQGFGDAAAVIQRLETIAADLGRGLQIISTDLEAVKQRLGALEQLGGKTHVDTLQTLAAIHHIYGSTGQLSQALIAKQVNTLDDFRRYLTPTYTGNP